MDTACASHEGKQLCEHLTREPAALSMDCGAATSSVRLLWTLLQLSRHHSCLFEADGILSPPSRLQISRRSSTANSTRSCCGSRRPARTVLARTTQVVRRPCAWLPFPFHVRGEASYLQSTAFGLARALQRLQQHTQDEATTANHVARQDQPSSEFRLGRLPRQKVRISRSRVMIRP